MFYVYEQSTLHNYADDNIVSHTSDEEKELLACLTYEGYFKTESLLCINSICTFMNKV